MQQKHPKNLVNDCVEHMHSYENGLISYGEFLERCRNVFREESLKYSNELRQQVKDLNQELEYAEV